MFIFADNTAWACNWTNIARAKSTGKRDQLAEMIALFRRASYQPAAPRVQQMQMVEQLPTASKLRIIEVR